MLAYSSDIYLIKTSELQQLPVVTQQKDTKEIILLLDAKNGDSLLSGAKQVQSSTEAFLPVRLAYHSYPKYKSFFINLIKTIKRKHYIISPKVYTIPLQCLYDNQVLRAKRTAANAYEWTNKRWQMSVEEKQKRWNDLYYSLKTRGFDPKEPILLVLNRSLGVKDQIFQGHHRLGICKELGILEVSVSFWAVHRSFDWLKLFVRKKV